MKKVTVATTQMACSWDVKANIDKAGRLMRKAAGKGAQIILLQELFETPYFCIEIDESYHNLSSVLNENEAFQRLTELGKEVEVVLPFSQFCWINVGLWMPAVYILFTGVFAELFAPNLPLVAQVIIFGTIDWQYTLPVLLGLIGTISIGEALLLRARRLKSPALTGELV